MYFFRKYELASLVYTPRHGSLQATINIPRLWRCVNETNNPNMSSCVCVKHVINIGGRIVRTRLGAYLTNYTPASC